MGEQQLTPDSAKASTATANGAVNPPIQWTEGADNAAGGDYAPRTLFNAGSPTPVGEQGVAVGGDAADADKLSP